MSSPAFRSRSISLLLVTIAILGACATAPPKAPLKYRDDVVVRAGKARKMPVALMATYTGSADDAFIVHHYTQQAGRLFSDRIVVYDAKDAGDRVLIVLDEAALAYNGGLFNTARRITLKGYVKHPGKDPVKIESTYFAEEKMGPIGYFSLWGGWGLTLVSIVSGVASVPYVPLIAYIFGAELRNNYNQSQSNSEQGAIDKVSSGALASFLNEAWKHVDDPAEDTPAAVEPSAPAAPEAKEPTAATPEDTAPPQKMEPPTS